MEHTFTIVYKLPEGVNVEDAVERLGAAGLTDAVVGLGRPGHISLQYQHATGAILDNISIAIKENLEVLPEAVLFEIK